MVPLIELRGAIPVATAWNLMTPDNLSSIIFCYSICILGNMLPVPVIYLFARKFLEWGCDKRYIGKMCTFFIEKGKKGGEKLQAKVGRTLFLALFLFVGIPLPGTGAWTGCLVASVFDMDRKKSFLAVMTGIIMASIIMMILSYGLLGGIIN